MKRLCLGIVFLFSICISTQNKNYIDSISDVIKPLSDAEQRISVLSESDNYNEEKSFEDS